MFRSALSLQLRKRRAMVKTLCTSLRKVFVAAFAFAGLGLVLIGLAGCGGSGGLSAQSGAPPLEEFDDQGSYSPYYVTGELAIPRYLHSIVKLADGQVLIVGGTEESGFSTLDSAEIFDQTQLKRDEGKPESETGTWFDTDFEGDPITTDFGRVWHTTNLLADNTVIVIGGAQNMSGSLPIPDLEIFDPVTRTFENLEAEMMEPRFLHSSTLLDDGRILVVGGQFHDISVDDQQVVVGGGFGGGGGGTVQVSTDIFPSTRVNEVFSITEEEFAPLTLPESTRRSLLTPSRGRSGHCVARFAGPDNRLNTGDDLYLLVGGYQTQSGENAPDAKRPGSAAGGHTQLEFYDPVTGVFTEVPVIRMFGPRINFPQATNLGVHSEATPDGVRGMGNAILVCNGDDNGAFGGRTTTSPDEVYIATFSGFGPAQGLQLFRQNAPFNEHSQGIEAAINLSGGDLSAPPTSEVNPLLPIPCRSTTNIVVLPRRLQTISGSTTSSWIFTGGGAYMVVSPTGGQIVYTDGSVAAGTLFDPFYSITSIVDFDSSSRDLRPGRRNSGNPVGIIGTWLALDGSIPDNDDVGFADTAIGDFAELRSVNRLWSTLIAIAGQDGIDNTVDDRILFAGGGQSVNGPGGEPVFPSSEVLVMPDS